MQFEDLTRVAQMVCQESARNVARGANRRLAMTGLEALIRIIEDSMFAHVLLREQLGGLRDAYLSLQHNEMTPSVRAQIAVSLTHTAAAFERARKE